MSNIVIELYLSEHDTHQLLKLIRAELHHCDDHWKPYWQNRLDYIEKQVVAASIRHQTQRFNDGTQTS